MNIKNTYRTSLASAGNSIITAFVLCALMQSASAQQVFINEIHYDNSGTDQGEAIEVAGPAGASLAGWSLVLYNGSNGAQYNTLALAGLIPNQQGGFGTVAMSLPTNGLQNGSPDGIALVNGASVIQFLSYEGTFVAADGPATGILSIDIGVEESSGTAIDDSLQLTGFGSTYGDFIWAGVQANTFGAVNTGQSFGGEPPPPTLVINEIDYDQPGTDTAEFVEILNAGVTPADLTGWTLELINGSGGGAALYNNIDLSGFVIAAGDYFVVCANAATVANCDLDSGPDTNFIQNGSPDAVSLRFDGNTMDAVSYEGDAAPPYVEGTGFGLEDPGADGSISRCPDGTDTGQNNVDLVFAPRSTPGAENACPSGAQNAKIHEVQGSGAASPLVGVLVAIEGVVVGDFQDGASGVHGDLNGFFVQEEDADVDADPATSEGIFVFDGGSPAVDVVIGDSVRVEGLVSEFFGLTEITSFAGVTITGRGNPMPTAAVVTLPVASTDDFEAVEGMAVTLPQALVIAEYFNFDRFNETLLTSVRHTTPTAEFEPGPLAIQAAQDFLLDSITLDDGRTTSNPDPAIHPNGLEFDLTNLFRGGDTVQDVTGVMYYAFDLYRIQPTQGANYANENPRTDQPDAVGGSLRVASFNVLNYFTTLDDGVNDICGPSQNLECRGADNADEFTRQRAKIIAALINIDAGVVGLIEIENNINDDAVIDLVDGLNAATAPGTYAYVDTGTIGTDAIKVALIYKPASASLVGGHAILDTSVDGRFNDTKNRPALAQSFMDNSTGGVVTIAVNHLKSKGSPCDDVSDPDTGDGSGNCNLTRKAAAEALVDWLATDPTVSGSDNALIIGDLNSYDKEDPIDAIRAGGYEDLVASFLGEHAYSYLFGGQTGYLDHALANAALNPQVTGVTVWHINADEPDLLDYDTSFKGPNQDAIYAPDAFRSSDHDPVIIGLDIRADILPPNDVFGRGKGTKVDLSWTDTGADSYDVFRSDTEGGPHNFIGSTANNVYVDSPVVAGNTYYYVVQSVLGGANSANSNEATVVVPAGRRRR